MQASDTANISGLWSAKLCKYYNQTSFKNTSAWSEMVRCVGHDFASRLIMLIKLKALVLNPLSGGIVSSGVLLFSNFEKINVQ